MKYLSYCAIVLLLAACSATINQTTSTPAYDTDVVTFAKSMGTKCFSEISGTTQQKQNFCSCVERTVKTNMTTKLTLSQIKETITGAAQGMHPVPNSALVFASVKSSCASALR